MLVEITIQNYSHLRTNRYFCWPNRRDVRFRWRHYYRASFTLYFYSARICFASSNASSSYYLTSNHNNYLALCHLYTSPKKKAVSWSIVNRIAPGVLLGACLGALVADSLSSNILRIFFGLFEILVAIQIWFEIRPMSNISLPGKITADLSSLELGIGFIFYFIRYWWRNINSPVFIVV